MRFEHGGKRTKSVHNNNSCAYTRGLGTPTASQQKKKKIDGIRTLYQLSHPVTPSKMGGKSCFSGGWLESGEEGILLDSWTLCVYVRARCVTVCMCVSVCVNVCVWLLSYESPAY